MKYWITEAVSFALMFVAADIHAARFTRNKPVGKGFHAFWGAFWAVPTAFMCICQASWLTAAACVLMRAGGYSPLLNALRRKPFFYLHSDPRFDGSLFDRIFLKFGWLYKLFVILCLSGFIALTIKLIA